MTPHSEEATIVRSFRLPRDLMDRIEEVSTDNDRSVNWLVVDALKDKFMGSPKVQFPESQFGSAGFTYMATLTWNMPGFDTGLPESDTELIIDRMMTEICHLVREHGAQDIITVNGPWMVQPMSLRKTRNYPEGTTLQHGAGATIVDDVAERQRPPDDTGSWVGDKASEWKDNTVGTSKG